MDTYTPPKIPVLATLRKMKPKSLFYFTEHTADSVKALVHRVRQEYPTRRYRTSKCVGHVKVWRDA